MVNVVLVSVFLLSVPLCSSNSSCFPSKIPPNCEDGATQQLAPYYKGITDLVELHWCNMYEYKVLFMEVDGEPSDELECIHQLL